MKQEKEQNFISAVVYLHNQEKQAGVFLQKLQEELSQNFQHYEIICVDDASTDGSIDCVHKFAAKVQGPVVSILHMSYHQGCELAMNAGVDLAIGDFVFEFDSVQMDYEPNLIHQVYAKALMGYDIVNAAPKHCRQLSSRIFYTLYNRFSKAKYPLRTESFRVLSRRVLNRVNSMSKTIPYRKALYANCGLRMDTIVYVESVADPDYRVQEVSSKRRELAADSLILFTDIGYKFSLSLTLFMMMITVMIACYALGFYLGGHPVAGWTSMMLLLSGGFFGMFAIAAIIIKYLAILVDLVFKKRKYTVEGIEKLTK